jgi:DNA-binding transcriptional regulator YiaG
VFVVDKIKEMRKKKQMVQRQFAVALETYTPMYSKIERSERRAKRVLEKNKEKIICQKYLTT